MKNGWLKKEMVILAALAVVCVPAFGENQNNPNTPLSDSQTDNQSLSTSGEGTMEVYYDFVEDGKLKGGKVIIEAPSAGPELFSAATAYNAYTLIDNGPSANRIDLVFVGDGYTASEMDLYLTHVTNIVNQLFSEPPLNEYASYFNVHVVEVISNQSGVDEPGLGIYRDTALDMAFDCQGIDRLLCVNTTKVSSAAANARAKDLVIAVGNTTRYGGAGYASAKLATVAGGNGAAVEVALHEFGHSFAKLADEYQYYDGTIYTGGELTEANISKYNAATQLASHLKWYRWLDLPEVDTFEGAKYKQYGIYRPTDISKMNALGYPFGPVNEEQFVFNVYQTISGIDSSMPMPAGITPSEGVFSVGIQTPATHQLNIQWQIDGMSVPDANQTSFCPEPYLTVNTIQTLKARVTDNTALVRDETKRVSLLTDEKGWQVWRASADFNGDGIINATDLYYMAAWWLSDNQDYDIAPPGGDRIVNLQDFVILARQWEMKKI